MKRPFALSRVVGVLAVLALSAAATGLLAQQRGTPAPPTGGTVSSVSGAGSDWSVYLGDAGRTHYSILSQITKGNVERLRVAWTFDTGDRGEYQANNLIVRGVLYTATPTR